jgi:hypothetical protein
MPDDSPQKILIECRSCGIENQISGYIPGMYIHCNQCRERLIG